VGLKKYNQNRGTLPRDLSTIPEVGSEFRARAWYPGVKDYKDEEVPDRIFIVEELEAEEV